GATITTVKIAGISHEFSVINGIKEDVITILLNLKRLKVKLLSDEAQTLTLKIKGAKVVTAADIKVPGQVEILNPELPIATMTDKNAELDCEMMLEKGLGYVTKENLQKGKMDIGLIALDASFTPIRRATYEVENMRVGDRTDFNRLRLSIETDGTITPKEALERSIEIMISQLKSIIGFKEEEELPTHAEARETPKAEEGRRREIDPEVLKTRIETLGLSPRTVNALATANIRTVGGLARKKEEDILEIEGLGQKGVQEIKRALSNFGISLK
ncbi:MAG: DNA-directed RNA polymerase subunit alpha, partial [bacterium]|nr:DNA-directed RNA polymerase subunit alpha [bacterium]